MRFEFSSDELILVLVSLIRATNPAMLRPGSEGFTVDFESIENKRSLSADEQLLLKLRAVLESPAATTMYSLEVDASERPRLVEALERVESLQPWPTDVLEMSRRLRARLAAPE